MNKNLQAKHIADEAFLAAVAEHTAASAASVWDVAGALGMPDKVVRAKAASLIRRGLITGCACGCRGDFELVVPTCASARPMACDTLLVAGTACSSQAGFGWIARLSTGGAAPGWA